MINKNISQAETELLKEMSPILIFHYNYVKNDMPGEALPEIIRAFQILKRDWTDESYSGPIELPDREDLIEYGPIKGRLKSFIRRVFKIGKSN